MDEYSRLMRAKLAYSSRIRRDNDPLLGLMEPHAASGIDFTRTFRLLSEVARSRAMSASG